MANFYRSACLSLALCALAPQAIAQSISQRLPISLDADSSVFDRRNDQIVFKGLRITQGAIGIEADEGVTTLGSNSKLDFADSVWKFDGNVKIDIETAKIRSDSAELVFSNHTLQRARVQGAPALFSDTGAEPDSPLNAQAR
ncbi:MAG: hypothetical protein AAF385_01260, partial [Pseudomonadota bacterium]